MKFVEHTWRYHTLYKFERESLDEAVGMAWAGADAGSNALQGIEILDDNGDRVGWMSREEVENHEIYRSRMEDC